MIQRTLRGVCRSRRNTSKPVPSIREFGGEYKESLLDEAMDERVLYGMTLKRLYIQQHVITIRTAEVFEMSAAGAYTYHVGKKSMRFFTEYHFSLDDLKPDPNDYDRD